MIAVRFRPGLMAAGLLAAFAVAIRLPFLHVPMISDEGGYSYVAKFWTDSYRLYRDIPFDRPPGIFLIYRTIFATLGSSVIAIRLGAAIWNAATTVAVFLFTKETSGSTRAAALSALLFAIVSTAPDLEGFTANAELFAVLPLVVAAHLTWRQQWFWAGVLAGVATVIKPIGVAGMLLTVFWLWQQKASWRSWLSAAAGYGTVGLVALLHVAWIDWAGFWASQHHKIATLGEDADQLRLLTASILHTAPAWFGLALLAGIALRGWTAKQQFGLAWIAVSLIGMALGGNWSFHYWTQLMPALAWSAAPILTRRLTTPAVIASALGFLIFMAVEGPMWFGDPRIVSFLLYQRPGYWFERDIATYLKETTRPTDTIQVAFWEAAIYTLADRRASVPHLYFYEYTPSSTAYREVLAGIQRRQPAAVVWVNGPPAWAHPEDVRATLATAGYEVDRRFGQILVYRRSTALNALH